MASENHQTVEKGERHGVRQRVPEDRARTTSRLMGAGDGPWPPASWDRRCCVPLGAVGGKVK